MFDPTELQQMSKSFAESTEDVYSVVKKRCQKPGTKVFLNIKNEDDRDHISKILKNNKYPVIEGSKIEDIKDALKNNEIGLFITNLKLPGAGEVLSALKESHLPFIVLTDGEDHGKCRELREEGICMIPKNINKRELLHEVVVHFGPPLNQNKQK